MGLGQFGGNIKKIQPKQQTPPIEGIANRTTRPNEQYWGDPLGTKEGTDVWKFIYSNWHDPGKTDTVMNRYADQFSSTLKNLTGQEPTQQDWSKFWQTLPSALGQPGFSDTSYADSAKILKDYISTEYSDPMQQYTNKKIGEDTQNIINKQTQASIDYLNNPDVMKQIMSGYNRSGMLDSGAFNEGITNTLAGGASQAQINALQGTILPSMMSMQPINAGQSSFSGEPYAQFNLQQQLSVQNTGKEQ